jgi:hypothetical protein
MEDDPKNIRSPFLTRDSIQRQFDFLQKTVENAQKRIDYSIANDVDIKKAIEVVERFLRKKKRVCYGGQAINALLPRHKKFYDPTFDIPDYDFFSPTPENDVDELIDMLEKEGFTEINKKVGVHEGTMKVYVNFIPVADCSQLHPRIFKIIQARAEVKEGIYYCYADFLRLMMYLELSRPRGEVDRWKKVYERLLLLNNSYPVGKCKDRVKVDTRISEKDRGDIVEFCVQHKRLFVGPECIELLEENKLKIGIEKVIEKGGPVLFMSSKMDTDANDLRDILGGRIQIQKHKAETDQLYNHTLLKRDGEVICMIFEETSCHSYTTINLYTGNTIRIATPDTLLHLYYTLELFGKGEKEVFRTSIECLIQRIYEIGERARVRPTAVVPAFGLRCSGKQKGIGTLLKEKAERVEKARGKTRKNSKKNKKED